MHHCTAAEVAMRLVDGRSRRDGRVEIYFSGVWGSVCSAGWDNRDASVVCRQLGFSGGKAVTKSRSGHGAGVTWMSNVACEGTETAIQSCSFPDWGTSRCVQSRDAGVVCSGTGLTD